MNNFTCYESDREVRTAICHNGKVLTVGEVVDLLNILETTADGVLLENLKDKPVYCPSCGEMADKFDSFHAICRNDDCIRSEEYIGYDEVLAKPKEKP